MIRKSITMKDVAKHFGISNVTVSKAMSGKDGVSTQLRKAIKSYADEIGYIYNSKVTENKERSFHIGVIVADRYFGSKESFYLEMYRKLTETLTEFNYYSKLEVVSKDFENLLSMPSIVKEGELEGVIVLGQMKQNYLDMIISTKIPVVFLDFYGKNTEVPYVISDSFFGAYLLTNYLINNGHKEIGFVGSINSTSSIEDRYLGFYKSILENNIRFNSDYIIPDRNEDGKRIEFVLPKKMPTAFVCNCDETAYHFIEHLNNKGYSVPDDISIVGFDNYIYATLCKPQLTTIAVNIDKMARATVVALINEINSINNPTSRITITDNLIIRQSVKNISK